jgi:hypothetical protein
VSIAHWTVLAFFHALHLSYCIYRWLWIAILKLFLLNNNLAIFKSLEIFCLLQETEMFLCWNLGRKRMIWRFFFIPCVHVSPTLIVLEAKDFDKTWNAVALLDWVFYLQCRIAVLLACGIWRTVVLLMCAMYFKKVL